MHNCQIVNSITTNGSGSNKYTVYQIKVAQVVGYYQKSNQMKGQMTMMKDKA